MTLPSLRCTTIPVAWLAAVLGMACGGPPEPALEPATADRAHAPAAHENAPVSEPLPPEEAQPASAQSETGEAADGLPSRRAPALFRGGQTDPERSTRERVIRAFRERHPDWLACYESVMCRGEAEPARVALRFVVRGDGTISDARVATITEHCLASGGVVAVPGDSDGPLARCLLDVARSVTMAPSSQAFEAGFVFQPEIEGCATQRPGRGPCSSAASERRQ